MLLRNPLFIVFIFSAFALLQNTEALAQIQQPNRFEKERKFNDADFSLISIKSDGLALIRELRKYKSGKQTWEVILVDTTLKGSEPIEFEINNNYNLAGYEH